MAVFRRGDKWAVTVHDPASGAKRWVGTFTHHRQAKDAEGDARKQARRQHGRIAADEFANTWIDRYPRRRESTNIGHRERVSKFATDFAGRQLDQITRLEARAWALANRSRVESVRAMFSDAARDGLVADNPFSNLRLKGSNGRRDLVVPTDEELGQLAETAAKVQGEWGRLVLAPFIIFGAHTGLRPGELYAIRWQDINLTGNTVAVEWQWSQRERRLVRPKYDSTRTVFLPPAAKDALEAVARVRDNEVRAPVRDRDGPLLAAGRPDGGTARADRPLPQALVRDAACAHGRHSVRDRGDDGPQGRRKARDGPLHHVTERDARAKVAAAFGSNVRDLRPVSEARTGA